MTLDAPKSNFFPELLAPAGNFERFRTALLYGANAVYLGGNSMNLRASCSGLNFDELKTAVTEAEAAKAKVFFCINSFPGQADLSALPALIEQASECGVHAFIAADPGILRLIGRHAPSIPIHLSTQANTTNAEAVLFWAEQGVSRVNLARELSAPDMDALKSAVDERCPGMELEIFIHGSMCLAVSGQCLMSAWLNNRPANQGRCTQPCRFSYRATNSALTVEEATRPGEELWTITQDEGFAEIWAPDDLCLLPYLPWLATRGFAALKIEGRMKSPVYVAHVVDAYATALKAMRDKKCGSGASQPTLPDSSSFPWMDYMAELLNSGTRPLTSGFFLPGERRNFSNEAMAAFLRQGQSTSRPILAKISGRADGRVDAWNVEIRGRWNAGDTVELMLPGMMRPLMSPESYCLENENGEKISMINSGQSAILRTEAQNMIPGIFIRSIG